MPQLNEQRAQDRDNEHQKRIRDQDFFWLLSGSSVLAPHQEKIFYVDGTKVYAKYMHEGKQVDLCVMNCLTSVWAIMAANALNMNQNKLRGEQ